jgi:hypothetical protein
MDRAKAEKWAAFIAGVVVGRIGLFFLLDSWKPDYCVKAADTMYEYVEAGTSVPAARVRGHIGALLRECISQHELDEGDWD